MTTTADKKQSKPLNMTSAVATELMIRANEENNPAQACIVMKMKIIITFYLLLLLLCINPWAFPTNITMAM